MRRPGDDERHRARVGRSRQLVRAAYESNLDEMRRLLELGAWPDFIGRGPSGTALLVAAQRGHTEAVRMLLESQMGVGDAIDYGWGPVDGSRGAIRSALYWAVVNGDAQMVWDLLEYQVLDFGPRKGLQEESRTRVHHHRITATEATPEQLVG